MYNISVIYLFHVIFIMFFQNKITKKFAVGTRGRFKANDDDLLTRGIL